jgi:putative protease
MRRLLIERLGVPNEIKPAPISSPTSWRELFPLSSNSVIPNLKPEIVALCRSMEQIDAALEEGVRLLYLDFEDIRRYKDGVARVRAHRGAEVYLATPRIQKAGEQGFFKLIENAEPDGVLVRNLGALDYFRASPLKKVGDFSLNVANPLTAQILKNEGLEKLTISYDLNASQVLDLLRAAPPEWFELTLHQHMPMFHMEHCVFAAFLSEGKDHLTCGRPCDRHQIAVRDRVGMEHPVKADVGCRNTVYHERAQSGARYWEQFRAAGVNRFRIEFLIESGEQAGEILRNYRALLDGKIFPEELSQRLKVADQLGVTSGTLTVLR